jgi:hypothetical protein
VVEPGVGVDFAVQLLFIEIQSKAIDRESEKSIKDTTLHNGSTSLEAKGSNSDGQVADAQMRYCSW